MKLSIHDSQLNNALPADCRILFIIMLIAIMLSDRLLNVMMLVWCGAAGR